MNAKHFGPTRALGLILLGLFLLTGCDSAMSRSERDFLTGPLTLGATHTIPSLQSLPQQYRTYPEYLLLTTHQELLCRIQSAERAAVSGPYEWREGSHDLRRVAGRAAWVLEVLLGIDLPKVGPNSDPDQLAKVYRAAKPAVERHREAVLSNYRQRPERPVEDLKRTYAGKIRPGRSATSYQYAEELEKLFAEWIPVGKPLSTLEEIVGTPAEKRGSHVAGYTFDYQGVNSKVFLFYCQGGEIKHVSFAPN